jgi:hypothetical protein
LTIVVPALTEPPVITWSLIRVPAEIAVTVSVVPEIEPVNEEVEPV